jgi:HK97 family phage major capsid protein
MSDVIDKVAADILARTEAMVTDQTTRAADAIRAGVEEQVRALITQQVAAELDAQAKARKYRPEGPDRRLDGTIYGQLGLTLGDVELIHDILSAGKVADPRLDGPKEVTRNIVTAARQQRAMDTAESGFGAQLVPDVEYIPQIWDVARQQYGYVLGLVEERAMTGPTEKAPVLGNVPDMIYVGETTSAIGSATEYPTQKVATNEVTLTAVKLLAHYNYSGEMVEDSIVPFVGLLNRAFAMTLAATSDKLLVNGDTTNAASGNINSDNADPADTMYYLAADGIRHAALVDNTANAVDASASLTYEKLVNLPTLMIDRARDMHWGRPANPNQLVYLCNPELEDDILTLSELMTVDQAGAALATVTRGLPPLNGELVRIGRNPMVSTIAIKQTAADGKVDAADDGTKGQIICFNPTGLLWGIKRVAQVEVERRPGTDQWRLILSTRVAVGRYSPTGAASGIEWASVLYNI